MKKISPHLTIYKFPVTALSSITNRVTGVALTGIYIGYGLSLINNNDKILKDKYNKLNNNTKILFNSVIGFPLIYHTLGGLRHLYLDHYPKHLNNKFMTKSSIGLFGFSSLITLGLAYSFTEKNKIKAEKN